jgi:hypothetical protein
MVCHNKTTMGIAILIYVASIIIILLGIQDLKRFEKVINYEKGQDKYRDFYNRMYIYMLLLYMVPGINTLLALIYLRQYLLSVYARIKTAFLLYRLEKAVRQVQDELDEADFKFQHEARRRSLTDEGSH